MSDGRREVWDGPAVDEAVVVPTREQTLDFRGAIWEVRTDTLVLAGQEIRRDVLIHPGAVAVVALDRQDRVYLLRQYRHPVSMMLFEPPAGVMDRIADDALATAQRELVEEAGLCAGAWSLLVDFFTSPGASSEAIRVFLARDISSAPDGRAFTGEAEEASLPGIWIPLDDAVELALGGKVMSPTAVVGVLAAAAARAVGWQTLRPATTPWLAREHLAAANRVFSIKGG